MDEKNIEVLDFKFEDLLNDDIEIIEIDDYDIEIIEVEDDVSFDLPVLNKKINKGFLSKIREKLSSRKFAIVTTCTVTLIVTLTSVFLLHGKLSSDVLWKKQSNPIYSSLTVDNIDFSLNDSNYSTILVNHEYEEKGATVFIDGVDYSKDIIIDSSNVDTSHVGSYHVTYTYVSSENQVRTLYRNIEVIDNEVPTITLLGSSVYTMLVNDIYEEAGVIVNDNSNEELNENVIIENNIDTSRPGTYSVKYSVKDSSGNEGYAYRTVVVKYNYSSSTNSILYNSFTDNGIYFKGFVQNYNFQNRIMLKNKDNGSEYVFDTSYIGSNYYQISLDVSGLSNGNYDFYLVNDVLEPVVSNMTNYNRIVRSHIGDKLVTMSYDKNIVNMNVQDFEYLYDVVIDPGHGGAEYGAVNGRYFEKSINLEQSLYEKQRFEAHGLRVLLLRDTDDNYGIMMGDNNWEQIDRKGYAVGYYGSVSKIVYSNHHNSSSNSSSAGWEILVPSYATYEDLSIQHRIADIWSQMYIEPVNPYFRFYTKNYEDGSCNNKTNGEVYSFEDYYSVIRMPHRLFNVQNVLYEGAYINNSNDMYWYYDLGNWKTLSEVKIKTYVESIGVDYIEP